MKKITFLNRFIGIIPLSLIFFHFISTSYSIGPASNTSCDAVCHGPYPSGIYNINTAPIMQVNKSYSINITEQTNQQLRGMLLIASSGTLSTNDPLYQVSIINGFPRSIHHNSPVLRPVPASFTFNAPSTPGLVSFTCYIVNSYTQRSVLNTLLVNVVNPISVTATVSTGCSNNLSTVSVNAVSPNAPSPLQYALSNSNYQSSSVFTNVAAGTYTVNVKDAQNITGSTIINVSPAPSPIQLNAPTLITKSCGTNYNGELNISASGGTGILQYTLIPGNFSSLNGQFRNLAGAIYTVQVTDAASCSSTLSVNVLETCTSKQVKAFLQGMYSNGTMNAKLYTTGITSNNALADSVEFSLRQSTPPYVSVLRNKVLWQTNGMIDLGIPSTLSGNSYYLSLLPKNGIETWSAAPINWLSTSNYDFSNAITKTFGSNAALLSNGVYGLYSGDINQDGAIDGFDYLQLETDIIQGSSGYLLNDLNGDGVTDAFDYLSMESNIIAGITIVQP